MAEVIWTETALADLDAIADFIALQNPAAAHALVYSVFQHVEKLIDQPRLGSYPPELKGRRYRQIVELPCRVFCRQDRHRIYVLYVMRGERLFLKRQLAKRVQQSRKR
jgi:toxin ParE1/3/4